MAKATMKLIQQLRSQLPPEASEQLDELEGMANSDAGDDMADEDMSDDYSSPDSGGSDDEGSDEPADVNAVADEGPGAMSDEEDEEPAKMKKPGKKKSKGLSFFA